jgi:hypothetical protein
MVIIIIYNVLTTENTVNKIHHKYWRAFVGYFYIWDLINARKMEPLQTVINSVGK